MKTRIALAGLMVIAACLHPLLGSAQKFVPSTPEKDEIAAFGKLVEPNDNINGMQAVTLLMFSMRYMSSGRHEDAIRVCSVLLKKSSSWENKDLAGSASNCLAHSSIAIGRFDEAESYVNGLLKDDQRSEKRDRLTEVNLLWTLGRLYRARGYLALADSVQAKAQFIVESTLLPPISLDPLMSPQRRAEAERIDNADHQTPYEAFQSSAKEYQRLSELKESEPSNGLWSDQMERVLAGMKQHSTDMGIIQIRSMPRRRIEQILKTHLAVLRERWELARALGKDAKSKELLGQIVVRTPQYTGALPMPNESLAMHRAMHIEGREKEALENLGRARWAALENVGYPGSTRGTLSKVFNNEGAESLFGSPSRSGLVSASIAHLGRVYLAEQNLAQAKRFLEAALEGTKFASGEDSDDAVLLLVDLSTVEQRLGNNSAALEHLRMALKMVSSKSEDEILLPAGRTIELVNARERASMAAIVHLSGLSHDELQSVADREALLFGAFHLLRRSFAEGSIAAAAIRKAQVDPVLSKEMESYQTTAKELAGLRAAYARLDSTIATSTTAPLMKGIEEKKAAVAAMRTRISAAIPRASLAFSQGQTFDSVVQVLGAEEAIVQFAFDDEKGFVLLTTKNEQFLRPLARQRADLMADVKRLIVANSFQIVGKKIRTRPFPLELAHSIYENLLGPVRGPLEETRRLFIVADGPLEGLPFGALLRSQASPTTKVEQYGQLNWLARRLELSYLPSAAALHTLRQSGATSAKRLLLGIGGPKGVAARVGPQMRGSFVDHGDASPTPKMAPDLSIAQDELTTIGRLIDPKRSTLYLGSRATKASLLGTALQNYKVIVFATHGYLASAMKEAGEPSLLLSSPPGKTGPSYLVASEVASFRLDANLVVLNACDTAGPDGLPGADALSGFASAFFFAGARSVIVSLWPVYNPVAQSISVELFRVAKSSSPISGANALRSASMKVLTRKEFRHPAFWASYILVGDGAVSPF
jgi:CHAT domain-containing protein